MWFLLFMWHLPDELAAKADAFDSIERLHNRRMRRRIARRDLSFSTLSQPSVISR